MKGELYLGIYFTKGKKLREENKIHITMFRYCALQLIQHCLPTFAQQEKEDYNLNNITRFTTSLLHYKESLDKKELRRSDFLIAIEEYVGAKGNTLVDHKKKKI